MFRDAGHLTEHLCDVAAAGKFSAPRSRAGEIDTAAGAAVDADDAEHAELVLLPRLQISAHLLDKGCKDVAAVVTEEGVVELLLDVSPAAGTVQGKFRAGQLDDLDILLQSAVEKFLAEAVLLIPLLLWALYLGGGVEQTVADE